MRQFLLRRKQTAKDLATLAPEINFSLGKKPLYYSNVTIYYPKAAWPS